MDENQNPELNFPQTPQKNSLKEQFTTVTTFSKFLAMVLFVALPFVGFWLGTMQIEPINTNVTSPSFSGEIQSTSTATNKAQIRNVDWRQYLDERFSSSLYTVDCGDDEQHNFSIDKVEYADLNYDEEEDAVIKYYACWNGTSGGQSEVLTLTSSGLPLPLAVSNGVPEGEEKQFEGARGHGYYGINKEGKLQFDFPIYKGIDPNCCPSGGTKIIVYEWNKASQQFEVDRTEVLTSEDSNSLRGGDQYQLLENIRAQHPNIFSEPTDYAFEWRWRDPSKSVSNPPNIAKIQGKVISTSYLDQHLGELGEQSLLYQIETTLSSYFERESFTQATANDGDHPTNGSTVQGYEKISDGAVCLRIIEPVESGLMNYKIACGVLSKNDSTEPPMLTVGQYIEWEGKVSEYVQDCGGGENCLSYLRISLSEKMITDNIFEARINIENCVDKTLRGGETVKVTGRIQNVVPDIGIILSCADTKTSVTRK